ncbi:MAG: cobyric acid synthase [Candidatus Kuenenia sp.]|nr:cobyric acid synthase [Candidatus Kuenenia hertensis]
MQNKSIMIQGTGSHVGKSILVCALCRILKEDGFNVAPFKAQNMALNSFVTRDGKEMGRAQVAQAEAAGTEPMVEMNPILLKPTGDCGSQVVVMGKPVGNMTAKEYYQKKGVFVSVIQDAYAELQRQFDIIVIEGAGSPAEINLKDGDIVNMGMAKMASAPVLLVTDIDRGGAFAWIVGTMELLEEDEKERVKGIVFNKFRGDKNILKPGLDMLEGRINKPVVGVVPYLHDLAIDDEDSVSLENYRGNNNGSEKKCLDIVVLKLPRISNFTDFNALAQEDESNLRFVDNADEIGNPDMLIIPGTKNTICDLRFLKERGIFHKITALSKSGTMIVGICGGYQMMGKLINDPYHIESQENSMEGLGLFHITTTFDTTKQTFQVKAKVGVHKPFADIQENIQGYEIHMGRTTFEGASDHVPFARITERAGKPADIPDGCVSSDGNIMGTYIHGIFDNDEFRSRLINYMKQKKGIQSGSENSGKSRKTKDDSYTKLAETVRRNINMNMVYNILQIQSSHKAVPKISLYYTV